MNLREYLFKNKMTASEMARKLGINANYFRLIKNKRMRPGYELALKMELLTGGEVTISELRGNDEQ